MWVTWVRGLRYSVDARFAWVKFLRRLRGLRGSKFFYVGHNFNVGCVGQIYFCVGQIYFCVGQNLLHGSMFLRDSTFFV